MKQLIVIITCLHVLAHSVFGCCTDHGIATDGTISCSCSVVVEPRGHACSEESAGHEHDPSSSNDADEAERQAPASKHECKHEDCKWVVPRDDSTTQRLGTLAELFFPPPIVVFIGAVSPADGLTGPVPELLFALPVRLHVQLCVMLI